MSWVGPCRIPEGLRERALFLVARGEGLRTELRDQGAQLFEFMALELRKRRANRAGGMADDRGSRLHDAHRVARAAVAQRDVGHEELIDEAVGRLGVALRVRSVELDRGTRDEVEDRRG